MAKQSRSRRHKRSHGVKRGGSGNYTSASTYGSYVNGSGDSQYSRVFDQNIDAGRQSNVIVGAQGQWAQQPHGPTAQNLTLVQSAGKKKYVSKFEPGFNFNFKTSKTSFLRKKHRRKS